MAGERNTQPDVVRFMRCVADALGVRTAAELHELLVDERLMRVRDHRKIYKWWRGENGPSFAEAMMLLKRAGLLSAEARNCLDHD